MVARTTLRRAACGAAAALAILTGAATTILGTCGPFTDVSDPGFCPFVLELFTLGITTGTSPTTYDPTSNVTRLQMAAFLSRTVDSSLRRGSRRTAMERFWNSTQLGVTTVGSGPALVASDGADVWVANEGGTVSRVRASDGGVLETWTGAGVAFGVVAAMGKVLVTDNGSPGKLYQIDPSQPAGAVTTVATNLGNASNGLAFDGARIWTANYTGNSVSIVTPGATNPWTVTTVTTGFNHMVGPVFDGTNIWVADDTVGTLEKLDANGAILRTVTVGSGPRYSMYDGSNIWVPNSAENTVTVVRVLSGAVLATLTGNGLNGPTAAAFDGQRVLVTNYSGNSVSLWKAADLTALTSFAIGLGSPVGVCSDGVDFWIAVNSAFVLVRY